MKGKAHLGWQGILNRNRFLNLSGLEIKIKKKSKTSNNWTRHHQSRCKAKARRMAGF
jgi:hypothetical protein